MTHAQFGPDGAGFILHVCVALFVSIGVLCCPTANAQTAEAEVSSAAIRDESRATNFLAKKTSAVQAAQSPELRQFFEQAAQFNQQKNLAEEEKALNRAMDFIDNHTVSIDDAYLAYGLLDVFYEWNRMFEKQSVLLERFIIPRTHFFWQGTREQQEHSWILLSIVIHDEWLNKGQYKKIEPFLSQLDQALQSAKVAEIAHNLDDATQQKWAFIENNLLQFYSSSISDIALKDDELAEKMLREHLEKLAQKNDPIHEYSQISVMRDVADAKYELHKYEQAEYWLNQIKAITYENLTSDNLRHMPSAADEAILQRFALLYQAQGRYSDAEKIWLDLLAQTKANKAVAKKKAAFFSWPHDYEIQKNLYNLSVFYMQHNESKKAKNIQRQMSYKKYPYSYFEETCKINYYCLIQDRGMH